MLQHTERERWGNWMAPLLSLKLCKWISLWCYSQAPSDIFCWCLFKWRSDLRGNRPVANAQQDKKQLGSGRETERGREIELLLKVQRKLEGFMLRKGFVWNVFCVMRHPNSALWKSVTWSWKIKISPLACPSWSRLFSANTGPILFTKTPQLCIFSDLAVRLVIRRGCHFRAPAGRLLFRRGHCDIVR